MRILLVEDDPETADHLRKGLGQEGHELHVATHSRAGLFRAAGEDGDLLVVDRTRLAYPSSANLVPSPLCPAPLCPDVHPHADRQRSLQRMDRRLGSGGAQVPLGPIEQHFHPGLAPFPV